MYNKNNMDDKTFFREKISICLIFEAFPLPWRASLMGKKIGEIENGFFSINTHTNIGLIAFILTCPDTHYLSITLAYSHTLSLSLSHTHTLSLSISHSLFVTHKHTDKHSQRHTHTLSLSLTHAHTRTHTHFHTVNRTSKWITLSLILQNLNQNEISFFKVKCLGLFRAITLPDSSYSRVTG